MNKDVVINAGKRVVLATAAVTTNFAVNDVLKKGINRFAPKLGQIDADASQKAKAAEAVKVIAVQVGTLIIASVVSAVVVNQLEAVLNYNPADSQPTIE